MLKREVNATVGYRYKLVSERSKGSMLLGTITVPEHIALYLSDRGHVSFYIQPRVEVSLIYGSDANSFEVKIGTLYKNNEYNTNDCLSLKGITIEEFETIPGFSFAPSAAYLRSLVTEGL